MKYQINGINVISQEPDNLNGVEKFLDYFVGNYFKGDFPNAFLNHFEREKRPKTNNNLEGYNSKLKRFIAIAHS